MVYQLIGILFNLVTFPGILLSSVSETVFASVFGAPTYRVKLRDGTSREEFAAVCEEIGIDADDVSDLEAETLASLSKPKLKQLNRVVSATKEGDDDVLAEGEVLVHYSGMDSFTKVFLTALLPFVVSTLLCAVVFLVGLPVAELVNVLGWVVFWLGISFGAHAFPNGKATSALWTKSRESSIPHKLIGYPFVVVSKTANLLSIVWLDAIYALIIYFLVREAFYEGLLGMTLWSP